MKIIKRTIVENTRTDTQKRSPSPKSYREDGHEMVNVVESWINERASNRRRERATAICSLLEWKTAGADN